VSYILKKTNTSSVYNNIVNTTDLRDFSSVYSTFKTRLTNTDLYFDRNIEEDGVKYAKLIASMARVWDLYFALENAFEKYELAEWNNENSTTLLTKSVRNQLIADYEAFIVEARYWVTDAGGLAGFGNAVPDRAQAGNWPAKAYAAFGYAALGSHNRFYPDTTDLRYNSYEEFINRGIKASGAKVGSFTNRREFYWMHQTTGVNSNDIEDNYWAEGPFYFNYSLYEIIPFWHALRGTGNLYTYFNGIKYNEDPFHSINKNKPLLWLAELATPEGMTAPLDDGKQQRMLSSSMLKWSADYGLEETGKKFSYINSKSGSSNDFKLLELAIPRASSSSSPSLFYGNDSPDVSVENWKTAQIVRSTDLKTFVLMNGEKSYAKTSGEGHEQPDQLQLLFYKGAESFLMDAGYDRGQVMHNDKRNRYNVHNVMTMNYSYRDEAWPVKYTNYENRGGMESPFLDPDIITGRKKVLHPDVTDFYKSKVNNEDKVLLLQGKVQLRRPEPGRDWSSNEQHGQESVRADYFRKVIVVKDAQDNIDYIVDFNTAEHTAGGWHEYIMRYHFPKQHPLVENHVNNFAGATHVIGSWRQFNTPTETFYFYVNAVEHSDPIQITEITDSDIFFEEYESSEVDKFAYKAEIAANLPHFNTMGIFTGQSENSTNSPYRLIFDGQTSEKPYQAWALRHDSNTIDVIFMRSKMDSLYNMTDVNFDISDSGVTVANLKVDKGTGYGFARVKYNNGLKQWTIDPDYQINIKHSSLIVTNNVTLSGNNSLLDNSTYQFTGNVTIAPGSQFTLGTDTKINFKGSVSAIGTQSNPIIFKSADPNNPSVEYDEVVFDNNWDYNKSINLEWAVFEGGYNNAKFLNVQNLNIKNSTFRKAESSGLYIDGAETFNINDVSSENNTGVGLRIKNADGYIYGSRFSGNAVGIFVSGPSTFFDINRSVIENNTGNGITVITDAYITFDENRISKNGRHEIYSYSDADLVLGRYSNTGENNISDPVNGYSGDFKYVYKTSLSSEGENQVSTTTYAYRNYWGYYYPSNAMFYGANQNTSGYRSSDPTTGLNPSNYPTSVDYSEPGPMLSTINQTTSASALKASVEKSENQGRTLKFKTMFSDMRSRMVSEPNILRKISYIRKMNSITSKDKENLGHEKNEFSRLFSLLKQSQSVQVNSNELIVNRETGNPRNNHLINGYLELVELEVLFNEDKFKESIQGINELLPTSVNQDLKRSLLSLKLNANVELESYKEALNVLDEIEALEPDQAIKKGLYMPTDYSFLRNDLRRKAGMEPLDQDEAKVKPNLVEDSDTNLPVSFNLNEAYPNPYNPTTNISFDLPENSFVKIEVFDVGGRLVSTLAEKSYTSGTHSINFDASNLASGIYIVRAFLGEKRFLNKITLIK